MTFAPRGDISPLCQARTNRTFQIISSLAAYRSRLPALNRGHSAVIWSDLENVDLDNGLFGFARYIEENGEIDPSLTVLVLVNAHPRQPSVTGTASTGMRLVDPKGRPLVKPQTRFIRLPVRGQDDGKWIVTPPVIWRDEAPEIKLLGPPKSLSLFAALPERFQDNPEDFLKDLRRRLE
jgi:hypothetical protein